VEKIASEVEMSVMTQAGEDIGDLARIGRGKKRPVGGDDRKAMMFRERVELPDRPFFAAPAMALQFDEDVIWTKDADEFFDNGIGCSA
jgi:hypothetical protein